MARYEYSLGMQVRVKPCRVRSSCNRPVWVPATTVAHKAYSLQPDKVRLSHLAQTAYISTNTAACVTSMRRSLQHKATADVKQKSLPSLEGDVGVGWECHPNLSEHSGVHNQRRSHPS